MLASVDVLNLMCYLEVGCVRVAWQNEEETRDERTVYHYGRIGL